MRSVSLFEVVQSIYRRYASPSLFVSLLLLVTTIFFWDGMEVLTPFLFPVFSLIVWLAFGAVFVGAMVKACFDKETRSAQRFRFVILDLVVVLLVIAFPFDKVRKWCDFNLNLTKRMEVVGLAKQGKLARPHAYNNGVCELPPGLRYLSKGGGEVIVTDSKGGTGIMDPNTLHIFFYTYRGVLQRHSGFEYSADGKPPEDAAEAKELERLRTNWYWATY